MALKNKITKAEFDALADALKEHYKAAGDSYVLDTDEANGALAARDAEKRRADELAEKLARIEQEKKDAEAATAAALEEAARKKGDVTALEASWKTKLDDAVRAVEEKLTAANSTIHTLLVRNVASSICNEISVAPELMEPFVTARLTVEGSGDAAITRVLDDKGKPSALSLEEFKKELLANTKFAAIIKGANSSGGGTNGGNSNGGAGKKISEMSEAERVAHHKAIGGEAFARQSAAEKAA